MYIYICICIYIYVDIYIYIPKSSKYMIPGVSHSKYPVSKILPWTAFSPCANVHSYHIFDALVAHHDMVS